MRWTDQARRASQFAPGLWNWRTSTLLPQQLRGGIHDPEMLGLPLDPRNTPLILDVGANIGQTVMSLKRLAPRARIIAFEPTPFALAALIRGVRRYDDVTVVPAACGRQSGQIQTLFIPIAGGVVFSQQASLNRPQEDQLAAFFRQAGFTWVTRSNLRLIEQPIVVVALDDLGVKPDVIKIDAEGFEVEVLRGAERILREDSPTLFIETNQSGGEVAALLAGYGYQATVNGSVNTIFVK
jgi:FkbM family methyltransferase